MTSDEDHRDTPTAYIELLLQFGPRHPGHSNIDQQAAATPGVVTFEKRTRRRKCVHRIPAGAQHKSQSLRDSGIIVDDEYGFIRHRRSLLPFRPPEVVSCQTRMQS